MAVHEPARGSTMAPMSDPALTGPHGRRQPFALVVLAGLMLLKAVLILLVVWGLALTDTRIGDALQFPDLFNEEENRLAFTVLFVPVAALLIIAAIGLLLHRRRAWLLAMVMTGVFVATDIIGYLNGAQSDIWMALNIVTVFYLNQRDVRELVGDAMPDEPGPGGHA
jgi:hypothetical protein